MGEPETVIRVEGLGKKYVIGHKKEHGGYVALRDVLAEGIRSVGQRLLGSGNTAEDPTREEFWALKDVSFEVKRGEVIGIIGRNGAGKSTLLKILSRITEPTEGRIELNGRVASLLEVGTGFHPELTGRENIFLNGAILGMSRGEIKRKFDEIVAFAEVEKFLDTPVKRYSSGMGVRLGFAVAAHLEPEILIIDEVLAVGDAGFQTKCLGKIHKVARSGRTVLFVSHNMSIVERLVDRVSYLSDGRLIEDGMPSEVIRQYVTAQSKMMTQRDLSSDAEVREGSGEARLTRAGLLDVHGDQVTRFRAGESFVLWMECQGKERSKDVAFAVGIYNVMGVCITLFNSESTGGFTWEFGPQDVGRCQLKVSGNNLMPGHYSINLGLIRPGGGDVVDRIENALSFEIVAADVFGTGKMPPSQSLIFLPIEWSFSNGVP